MTIRVAQVATGNAGMLTLRQLISDDRFELVAVSTSTPEKVGMDAGELAGLDVRTGITAVDGLEAVIAAAPECVVYCAMGDTRPREATNDVRRLLEAGMDVVGSAPGTLQFPWGTMPQPVIDKVEASAKAGNATVYITGVDPGFASDLIPLALASTCQRIEQVKCYELADYATYDGADLRIYVNGNLQNLSHPTGSINVSGGALRIGISARLAKVALAQAFALDVDAVEEVWHGIGPPYLALFDWAEGRGARPTADDVPVFRPFMLAHPLDEQRVSLDDYAAEWKWDGIRVQIVRVGGQTRLYSRAGEHVHWPSA